MKTQILLSTALLTLAQAAAATPPAKVLLDFSTDAVMDDKTAIGMLGEGLPASLWKVYPPSKYAFVSQVEGEPDEQQHLRDHRPRGDDHADADDEGAAVAPAEDRHRLRRTARLQHGAVQGSEPRQAQAGHRRRGVEPGQGLTGRWPRRRNP